MMTSKMLISLSENELVNYVGTQCANFFPDGRDVRPMLAEIMPDALSRMETLISHVNLKYYRKDDAPYFSHLNTDQYAAFLYFCANTAYRRGAGGVADKLYALNKALHALDVFYAVELPELFLFSHPVGSVLGRAVYRNYFVCYQNCTVGGNTKLEYPVLGEGVALYANSAIIGNCEIGDNVQISAKSMLLNQNVPNDTIVCGSHPAIEFKKPRHRVRDRYFL
jgi:serine O-acetyltransferase